ncbi:acyl-CoA N-acyltransferase [Xylariaceae sp. FL1019]|nr:acyl-CoA N-acyltransferase [Xylariaceae sp. FL1019]
MESPLIEVVNSPQDIAEAFTCLSEAFGRQAQDAIWMAFNPGWDTPEGRAKREETMIRRWEATTTDKFGKPNELFLKATLPDPKQPDRRVIAGFAIWVQASDVEGYGNKTAGDIRSVLNLEALYPGNESEQRFLEQMCNSLLKRRVEFVKQKATDDPPVIMALDLCGVDPAFQRRGIATRLVSWGLSEARRRGIRYCTTEGSSMGRHVYQQLGFEPDAEDIVYEVDDEFATRDMPPNRFMRGNPKNPTR